MPKSKPEGQKPPKPAYTVMKPFDGDVRMNFNQAREYMGVGESTLRNYVHTGRLRAQRLGGGNGRLLFFFKSDLDALFEDVLPSSVKPKDADTNGVSTD